MEFLCPSSIHRRLRVLLQRRRRRRQSGQQRDALRTRLTVLLGTSVLTMCVFRLARHEPLLLVSVVVLQAWNAANKRHLLRKQQQRDEPVHQGAAPMQGGLQR